tara:strand:- start:278 stop:1228 length:951 start_codon:yes stop_codon:yes gene_type:complete
LNHIVINIIKGIFIGIANIIPGLSGATIALVLGVYQKSINVITKFDARLIKLIKNLDFINIKNHISLSFISSISLGIVISFVLMSNILNNLLEQYPAHTWAYFFGIIIASIPYVMKQISAWRRKEIILFIVGLVFSLSFLFLEPYSENQDILFIFFCGIVGGIGMLVPGLSGSYLLVILGNFKLILVDTIQVLSSGVLTLNYNTPLFFKHLKIFTIFMIGQFLCVILFSRFIKWIISHKKNETFSILSGFITGSLIYIWPWQKTLEQLTGNKHRLIDLLSYPKFNNNTDIYLILIIITGLMTIILIEKIANRMKNV